MTAETFFGTMTLIAGVAMAIIALPQQIIKNHKEKSCGLGIMLIILSLCVYGFRICYSITIQGWYILIPDSIGFCASAILLIQYLKYRKIYK